MNIKRIIDRNGKLIAYIILIIIFVLFAIKSLNSYYEKDEERKKKEMAENAIVKETSQSTKVPDKIVNNSIEDTMNSFVSYCNKREIQNAYKMLTQECKDAMFPTVEFFEKTYVNKIYNIKRTYELTKWSTEENKEIYLVSLYGDLLATGGVGNSIQEYYTFVKGNNGIYKLNINNYIYGEKRNLESTKNNISVKIDHVDIYEEYEIATIKITNNTSKKICLTGNKYKENIYLQDSSDVTYASLNSEFEKQEIVLNPKGYQTFIIEFNKGYSAGNKAKYLVLSDVILDYEDYLNSNNKQNYNNRTQIKVDYQK